LSIHSETVALVTVDVESTNQMVQFISSKSGESFEREKKSLFDGENVERKILLNNVPYKSASIELREKEPVTFDSSRSNLMNFWLVPVR